MAPGNNRYPQVKTPFRRQVHAPSPVSKFGLFDGTRDVQKNHSSRQVSNNGFGAFLTRNRKSLKRNALDVSLRYRTDVDEAEDKEKEVSLEDNVNSLMIVVDDEKSSFPVTDVSSFEAYRKTLRSAENRTCKLKDRGFGDALKERCLGLIRSFRSFFIIQDEEPPLEDVRREPFRTLSKEDETAVNQAFSANVQNVLVTHENSNIDITGEKLRCNSMETRVCT